MNVEKDYEFSCKRIQALKSCDNRLKGFCLTINANNTSLTCPDLIINPKE